MVNLKHKKKIAPAAWGDGIREKEKPRIFSGALFILSFYKAQIKLQTVKE